MNQKTWMMTFDPPFNLWKEQKIERKILKLPRGFFTQDSIYGRPLTRRKGLSVYDLMSSEIVWPFYGNPEVRQPSSAVRAL